MSKLLHSLLLAMLAPLIFGMAGCATDRSPSPPTDAQRSAQSDQQRARIRLQLAIGYYEQRQMSVALDEIRQALQADPNFADAYSVRGLIYMDIGENKLAEDSFLQAIKLSPNNPDFSNNYGWFLCQNDRAPQSIAYFESAMKVHSYQSPAKAMYNAGVCSLKLKDLAAAEKYFSQAFQYDPANLSTSANLAKLYFDRGDYERARFFAGRVTRGDGAKADMLWLAIKIERKLGDRAAESSLATQLRRRYPASEEYAAYQRGAFDE